jgi:cyclophilin family peptidyl-prolyl cis-trans isomerase
MSQRYIFGYIIIALALFGGLVYWFQFREQPQTFSIKSADTFDPEAVTLPAGASSGYSQQDMIQPHNANQASPFIGPINQQKTMNATFHTNKGDFSFQLFPEQAPATVENFVKLAQAGFYNGVKFHRIIKGFMIQGGDPLTKDDSQMARWGTGGPGYTFKDEIGSQNKNMAGTLAMANAGPNTNGSQFFINTKDNNFLDPKHTVFGMITGGVDIVIAIENSKTDPATDRPLEPVIINSITIN